MIEFKISNKVYMEPDNSPLYFLSIICLTIHHLTTDSKPEMPLNKLFIVYWATKSEYNLNLLLAAKERNFMTIPLYDISSTLNKMLIFAIINQFVSQINKSSGLYITLSPKGKEFVKGIYSKNLFREFQEILKEIGKIPNNIVDREVGLF